MDILGSGSFAVVRRAIQTVSTTYFYIYPHCLWFCWQGAGKHVAVKVISKVKLGRGQDFSNLLSEVDILQTLDHPGIIKYVQYLITTTILSTINTYV